MTLKHRVEIDILLLEVEEFFAEAVKSSLQVRISCYNAKTSAILNGMLEHDVFEEFLNRIDKTLETLKSNVILAIDAADRIREARHLISLLPGDDDDQS